MFKKVVLPLVIVALLAAAYFWAALQWSYSSGERAGWVQKLSNKGWICKTWEGELSLVSLPGSTAEKFHFTVHDDAVAAKITQLIGRRVSLHYEEKVGLPTTCFGETRHFVTGVTLSEDIPLAPGIVIQSQTPRAPASESAPTAPAAAGPAPGPAPGPTTAPTPAPAPAASR
jgi:hypothetical protein